MAGARISSRCRRINAATSSAGAIAANPKAAADFRNGKTKAADAIEARRHARNEGNGEMQTVRTDRFARTRQGTRHMNRRQFIGGCVAGGVGTIPTTARVLIHQPKGTRLVQIAWPFPRIPWQFRHNDLRDIGNASNLAAEMEFDGVEILHTAKWRTRATNIFRISNAERSSMASIDAGFPRTKLSCRPMARFERIQHTIHCIELAYMLGIPTIRVNTGNLGTSKNFDELMKNRGIEPPRRGYTDEDGFKWGDRRTSKRLPVPNDVA